MVEGLEAKGLPSRQGSLCHSMEQVLLEGKWSEHWHLVELASWKGVGGCISGDVLVVGDVSAAEVA